MATALTPSTTGVVLRDMIPNLGAKQLIIELPATVDDSDTFAINLTKYGGQATGFLGCIGFIHTTDNAQIAQEQPTTEVSSGTLTITVGGSTDNKKRTYIIYYI